MKESYSEGLANHAGLGSYAGIRKDVGGTLIEVRAGRVLSREIVQRIGVPTALLSAEGNIDCSECLCCRRTPRGLRPQACTETFWMGTGRSHGCLRKQTASGSLRTSADDERSWEVGPIRSTGEAAEQSGPPRSGGGGGKGSGQGKPGQARQTLDSEPARFAQRAGAGRSSSTAG